MDWQKETIKLIELHFKNIGIKYIPSPNLNTCLFDFMNLDMKLVNSRPRLIYKSDTLKSRVIPLKYLRSLSYIENKIKKGESITYHMSKRTLDPKYRDLLMNTWIIQHIHLSHTKDQRDQKFYNRSKYLLFAMFSENQAFFIDIREHNEKNVFAKQELLSIIDRNWPQILTVHNHHDAEFLNNQYTDADIDILRKKGYSITTTAVNGKIVINPGIGITTSGHNIHVIRRANWVIRYLYDSIQEVEKDKDAIKEALSKESNAQIKELDLCIHKLDKWPFFVLYENNSKCYIEKNYDVF